MLKFAPINDLVMAANQETTKEWWDNCEQFDLYVSAFVIQEAGAGDPNAAKRRLEKLEGILELDVTEEVETFATQLLETVPLPPKAKIDALHISVATINGMDYLLTWNCTHIANATLRPKIEALCREFGYEPPTICTPQELREV
ncbi:MAG: DNA-binding protein [Candidatus Parabeggiatoa sp. nov. 3]|nr:MAG: DNA-binding protein [Gammaproteobacteria bacterium]RKZ66606.1 MAG: DNA-binding protein [Gammaproteobacteria bacterium]RKZ82817.1 MAG: DNA-binding protein [Gammaproteobacteria bacterium]HEW98018.1 DNA-binding protein [Beggiatoa sp.]